MDGETESGPAAFRGFCLLSVDIPLQDGEGGGLSGATPLCGGEGGDSGLWLIRGVTGDGVRSVPLSFEAIVELVQLVGKA